MNNLYFTELLVSLWAGCRSGDLSDYYAGRMLFETLLGSACDVRSSLVRRDECGERTMKYTTVVSCHTFS